MANDMIEASGAPPPGCQDILGKSLSENTPPAGSGGTMKSPCHGNEPNRPTGYRQIRKPAAITAVNTFRDRSASRTCTGTAGRTNGNEQPASVIHGSLQHKTRRYYRRRSKSPPHRVNSFVKPTRAWISIASKVSQSQFCTPKHITTPLISIVLALGSSRCLPARLAANNESQGAIWRLPLANQGRWTTRGPGGDTC